MIMHISQRNRRLLSKLLENTGGTSLIKSGSVDVCSGSTGRTFAVIVSLSRDNVVLRYILLK